MYPLTQQIKLDSRNLHTTNIFFLIFFHVIFLARNGHKYLRRQLIWKITTELLAVGWAGLWKKVWTDYEQHFRSVSLSFHAQKNYLNWKYSKVRIEKLHKIKVNKTQKKNSEVFSQMKNQFFRTKNLSISMH